VLSHPQPNQSVGSQSPDQAHLVGEMLGRAELAPPQQRAAVSAVPGFLKTHVASVEAVAIKPLSAEVVFALFEIEPNHRVGHAMPLRLVFISKQGKWKGCAGRTELDDHDGRKARKRLLERARSSHGAAIETEQPTNRTNTIEICLIGFFT